MNRFLVMLALTISVFGCQKDQQEESPSKTQPTPEQAAAPAPATKDPVDLNGNVVDPFADPAPMTILLFVSVDCPISNRYAPEVRRLYDEFKDRGMKLFLVYSDPSESAEKIAKHFKEYDYPGTAVRDPSQVLADKAGASRTPEAALFDAHQKLVYRGRIDDRYADFGKGRPVAAERNLEDALKALVDGRPITTATTAVVGCYIPTLHDD